MVTVIKVLCHVCDTENIYELNQFKESSLPKITICSNCKTEFFLVTDMDSNKIVKFTREFDNIEELV